MGASLVKFTETANPNWDAKIISVFDMDDRRLGFIEYWDAREQYVFNAMSVSLFPHQLREIAAKTESLTAEHKKAKQANAVVA